MRVLAPFTSGLIWNRIIDLILKELFDFWIYLSLVNFHCCKETRITHASWKLYYHYVWGLWLIIRIIIFEQSSDYDFPNQNNHIGLSALIRKYMKYCITFISLLFPRYRVTFICTRLNCDRIISNFDWHNVTHDFLSISNRYRPTSFCFPFSTFVYVSVVVYRAYTRQLGYRIGSSSV